MKKYARYDILIIDYPKPNNTDSVKHRHTEKVKRNRK